MLNLPCLLLPANPKIRYMQFPQRLSFVFLKEKNASARTLGHFSDEIKVTFKVGGGG